MIFRHRQERARREGFEDALTYGRPNPVVMPDHELSAYLKGFAKGKRAVSRITDEIARSREYDL